jgi:hypothetical protein
VNPSRNRKSEDGKPPPTAGAPELYPNQFHNWVKNRSEKWGAPVLEAPKGRRDEFVEPYFRHARPDQLVVILKAREPARILTAIGNKKDNRWHLQLAQRWVVQYNFYVNDRHWGRMFVRLSPYFPFSARVCLNHHHWLARRMQQENIDFQQTTSYVAVTPSDFKNSPIL